MVSPKIMALLLVHPIFGEGEWFRVKSRWMMLSQPRVLGIVSV